jgi:hemolysin activation/secretion protein
VSGRSDYWKVTLEASRLQSLGGAWTFNSAVTSQYAFTPLLASEQLGLGGSQYLRSYDPSDIVGDSGVGSKFELQYNQSPKAWYLQDYQLYGYFDIGGVWNSKPQAADKTPDAGISLGFGSRFSIGEWASGYLEISQPIMRSVPTQGANDHNHQPRIFFALIAKF